MSLTSRPATLDDVPGLMDVMRAAIDELQRGFLDDAQIASSHAIMGLDTQLIEDATYFVVDVDGQVAGCGGWSRRATLYGADHSTGRDSGMLDPARDPARVRAMYTHPDFTRRGVGRLILSLCEERRPPRDSGDSSSCRRSPARPCTRRRASSRSSTSRTPRAARGVPLIRMGKEIRAREPAD